MQRALFVQTLSVVLSGRLDPVRFVRRVTAWVLYARAVRAWPRNALLPVVRAGLSAVFLTRSVRQWMLYDAVGRLVGGGDVLLTSLASGAILGSWVCAPERLMPGYKLWLDRMGMAPEDGRRVNNRIKASVGTGRRCDVLGEVMPHGAARWGLRHLATRSVPFYSVLHVLTGGLSRGVLLKIATSSLFLTTYCGGAWMAASAAAGLSRLWLLAAMCLPGTALALEPSRAVRQSVRHYCVCMALHTALRGVDLKLAHSVVGWAVLAFPPKTALLWDG